jgi:NAD dependent epimerase/dehydratase family
MAPPVLVTGGTGRLGKLVVARLQDSGCDVRVLARHDRPAPQDVTFFTADLRTGQGIGSAVTSAAAIIHCATSTRGDAEATRFPPARTARRASPRHPRRSWRGRSRFRQGAVRPGRGPVALRAGPASPRLRRMAAAAAPDQRRQARTNTGPGNLPAAAGPVMGEAGRGRAESVRSRRRRCARRTGCSMGADPPAAPDRPPSQRRPDQPRDRRPALSVPANG